MEYCFLSMRNFSSLFSGIMVKSLPAVGDPGLVRPSVGKIPWRRKWQPTPVFLPGAFHGQRSLAGCSPWGRQESEAARFLACSFTVLGLYCLFCRVKACGSLVPGMPVSAVFPAASAHFSLLVTAQEFSLYLRVFLTIIFLMVFSDQWSLILPL